jgi:hypothetical protein
MIKFDPPIDTHSQFDAEVKAYYAPTAGFYQVSEAMFHAVPTGNFILKPNPDRKWFEFWKPKMTKQPEFKVISSHNGVAIRYLEKDQPIYSRYLHKL